LTKHTILFLAANPVRTDERALDREARAIQVELERSGFRDSFELVIRWAAEPLDLLRELRKLKPAIVHFSGHSDRAGLRFPASSGEIHVVPFAAIAETFEAAGASVRLIVLSACDCTPSAKALLSHIDCIVGISDALSKDVVSAFVIGFYGALGEYESVGAAYQHGNAAISLMGAKDTERPWFWVRKGVDAAQLILAPAPSHSTQDARVTERVSSVVNAKQPRQRGRIVHAMAPILALLILFAAWRETRTQQHSMALAISDSRTCPMR
jgi:hypothetical protein